MARVGYARTLMLEFLKSVETFRGLDEKGLGLVADAFTGRLDIAEGASLCSQGQSAESWWVILEGSADVKVDGTHVGTIGKRDTVGELALFADEPIHGADVVASERVDVLEFDKGTFIDTVRGSPDLALVLLREAARRLHATNALVVATDGG